jgi:hypothetical protein
MLLLLKKIMTMMVKKSPMDMVTITVMIMVMMIKMNSISLRPFLIRLT